MPGQRIRFIHRGKAITSKGCMIKIRSGSGNKVAKKLNQDYTTVFAKELQSKPSHAESFQQFSLSQKGPGIVEIVIAKFNNSFHLYFPLCRSVLNLFLIAH